METPAFKCIASRGKRSVTATILIALLLAIVNPAISQSVDLTAIATNSQKFADLRSRAEHGDAEAEYQLGLIYTFGDGVPTNDPEGFHWLLKSGENGNSNAWCTIGDRYFNGDSSCNVASNPAVAAKWYLKAANQGNISAQGKLGEMLYRGNGMQEDYASAQKWFQKAAAGNDERAEFYLGLMYDNGQSVPQDYALAAEWYRKSANQGNADSQNNLGVLYEKGHGVPWDFLEAYKWFNLAAAQGDANAIEDRQRLDDYVTPDQFAQALTQLAFIYADGAGVPTNYPEAFDRLLKSAEGDSNTWCIIGDLYLRGNSYLNVATNSVEAAKWFLKAANQGNAYAQCNLGIIFFKGDGMPPDDASALKWFEKAAEGNDERAAFYLGLMYETGQGVPQDYALALEWYRKSANQAFANSQNNLGLMYQTGEGVPQDYALAAEWYRKSANQGIAASQINLGTLYENGLGVPKDDIEAYKWFDLAASQGETNAVEDRQRLADFMTPGQITQAREMSHDFRPDVAYLTNEINSVSSDAL